MYANNRKETNKMMKYEYYNDEERDACDISEEQRAYVFALGLTIARIQLGK